MKHTVLYRLARLYRNANEDVLGVAQLSGNAIIIIYELEHEKTYKITQISLCKRAV